MKRDELIKFMMSMICKVYVSIDEMDSFTQKLEMAFYQYLTRIDDITPFGPWPGEVR